LGKTRKQIKIIAEKVASEKEVANGSRASCTNVQSSGGSSKSTSDFTERISKYLIQYVPDTPVRKKSSLKE